jgi:DNA-binding transcriptional LysR family regulator
MNAQKLDTHSLVVFYFVGREKSMTAAAEKLFLTQPTVTYHIKSLEKSVGVKLIAIKGKQLFLTHAGEGLFQHAERIYRQLADVEKFTEDLKEASLRISVAMSCSSTVTPAVAAFRDLYPHIKLVIENVGSFKVIQSVLNWRADLGIAVSLDYGSPELRRIAISAAVRTVPVASPSLPISQEKQIRWADLLNYPLILPPEEAAMQQIILNKFKDEGLKMHYVTAVEVDNMQFGKSLVESGEGISIYYIKNVEKEVLEGRMKILPVADDIWVGIDVLVRRDHPLSLSAKRFISLVKAAFQSPW